ncbi:mitochondrial ribosomal protein S16 [Augochlora pura]
MPRIGLHHASGTGISAPFAKAIRLVRLGCANRPFYHIVVMHTKQDQHKPPIEQLGSYDPMENKFNEVLIALNFQRIQHWIGQGVAISNPVAELFGLAGFYPIHPRTIMHAWRNRRKAIEAAKEAKEEPAKAVESAG